MKVAGRYTLDAPPDRVWPVIHDPASLVRLIPGCEKLEQIGPAEYRGQMQLWLAGVAGKYETRVKLIESGELYHPTSRSRTQKDHRLLTDKSDRDNYQLCLKPIQRLLPGIFAWTLFRI